jgi:hypothetical protein
VLFAPIHRHLPRSPLSRRDKALRAELTHLGAAIVKIEREQEIQFRRIAQIQQDLDEVKRLLKKIASNS